MTDVSIRVEWKPSDSTLRIRLSGILSLSQVEQWEQALEDASRGIPQQTQFRMLADIRGYEVSEQEPGVHRRQRVVLPTFLARHGFEVGFFRMFDVVNTIAAEPDRPRCVAVAHVHHSCEKMELYNANIGSEVERFFCDPSEAEEWLGRVATGAAAPAPPA